LPPPPEAAALAAALAALPPAAVAALCVARVVASGRDALAVAVAGAVARLAPTWAAPTAGGRRSGSVDEAALGRAVAAAAAAAAAGEAPPATAVGQWRPLRWAVDGGRAAVVAGAAAVSAAGSLAAAAHGVLYPPVGGRAPLGAGGSPCWRPWRASWMVGRLGRG